ncbi:MAG TPA: hypothetical protein DCO72_06245 [Ruminococcus sp.]|nr:hypothetical protein [Ruminococcus sp.]
MQEKRSEKVEVRFTMSEHNAVVKYAEREKITKSDTLRKFAFGTEKLIICEEGIALAESYGKLKQMSFKYYARKYFQDDTAKEVMEAIIDNTKQMRDLTMKIREIKRQFHQVEYIGIPTGDNADENMTEKMEFRLTTTEKQYLVETATKIGMSGVSDLIRAMIFQEDYIIVLANGNILAQNFCEFKIMMDNFFNCNYFPDELEALFMYQLEQNNSKLIFLTKELTDIHLRQT